MVRSILCKVLFVFGVCVAFGSQKAQAQDLIVTLQGDSIESKIREVTDQFIFYRTKESRKEDLVISRREVLDFRYGFYSEHIDDYEEIKVVDPQKHDRIQVYGSAGYARSTAIDEDANQEFINEYLEELKNGWYFDVGVRGYFTERFGLGFEFTQSKFNNELANIGLDLDTTTYFGNLSDQITMNHFGVNFIYRIPFKNSGTSVILSGGMGYSTYTNDAELIWDYTLEASTIGMMFSGELVLPLGGNVYLPIKLKLHSVAYTNFDITYGDAIVRNQLRPVEFEDILESSYEDEFISGARLEVGGGILFAF